ncbi:S41 family peptidase [Conexibacter sp. DBS9H8]|uniref:S41 family peptidase n=1 Tax=Conexibacter sp. DBS9H8 TaxID=2937801 RepID=UPI00200C83EF|nr:S41 family peptidase [Conexibacter sp. DBS9H8]
MNSPPRRPRTGRVSAALLAVLVLLLGVFLGGHSGWMPGWLRSAFTNQTGPDHQFASVLGLIEKNYYRPVNAEALVNKSLEGAVASLNDPYSHYFPPAQQQQFQQETNPQVSGIGVTVSAVKKGLYVDQVFPGGPAAEAKVQQGEVIVAVDGRTLQGLSVTRASNLIRGRSGTKVTITLQTGSHRRTITVTREQITEPVASSTLLHYHHKKLGYLVFAQFTQGSANQLRAQVTKMLHAGAQGLILDLRDNPGGLLNQAVAVASLFIKDGTIVSTRGRNQPTTVYTALGDAVAPTIPMVVIVNRGTASSAEIVTSALQESGRAKVVGTRTYGKGVFQESQTVTGGGILDITVGEFFTRDGQNLGGRGVASGKDLVRGPGIKPNVYVYDNPDNPGPAALKKAESVLAGELH